MIKNRIEHYWKVYHLNQELIKFADQKIRFLLLISGVSTTYVLSSTFKSSSISITLLIAFYLVFFAFVFCALSSIKPRYKSHSGSNISKNIFFKDILRFSFPVYYYDNLKEQTDEELLKDLAFQIHSISKILEKKYNWYDRAFYALVIQLILFFIIVLFAK